MTILFINIKQLLQIREANVKVLAGKEMATLPLIENAFLLVKNGIIQGYGSMNELTEQKADEIIDCSGRLVLPSWCDSHTHLVFGEDRSDEFVDRVKGLSYEEIAQKGGGILNSAKKINQISEDVLFEKSVARLKNVIAQGTGALEIKSGYGLTVEGELKILRVIKRLKETFDIPIKSTFLGAHAIPKEYKNDPDNYVDLIINEMLPKVSQENLAHFIDAFCEVGYFTPQQMNKVLKAGKKYGLIAKVHVNQFNSIGGIEVSVNNKALSVDHLEILSDKEISLLKNKGTIPVSLPLCSLFLEIPYTPSRKIIDSGLPLAIASDFNPGSAPSSNMNLVVALSCIKMKLSPEEAINAATLNGAYAMNLENSVGSITVGKKANLIITKKVDSYQQIPYYFGDNLVEQVLLNGKIF